MKQNKYNPEARGGGWGWAGVAVGVLAYDVLANETLTNAFARGREHDNRLIRCATVGALGYTALHLMDKLPPQIDGFDQLANGIGKAVDKVGEWATKGIRLP